MKVDRLHLKDIGSGSFFTLVGAVYLTIAYRSLPIGRALEPGPGAFPVILSGTLTLIGLALIARGLLRSGGSPFGVVPWRALCLLTGAILVFATLLDELGLLLVVLATTFLAALASPAVHWRSALLVAVAVGLFCTAVFGYGIKLPIPILGSWLVN